MILLIAPNLFDYTRCIIEELGKEKLSVDYIDVHPVYSRFAFKMNKYSRDKIYRFYYKNQFTRRKGKQYKYVLIINGSLLERDLIEGLKQEHKDSTFILHNWDSISNNSNAIRIMDLFDRVTSFDVSDCNDYGFTHVPNFYTSIFDDIRNSKHIPEYDVTYIGSYTSERYNFLKSFFIMEDLRCNFFLYIGFFGFLKESIKERELLNWRILTFKKIKNKDLVNVLINTKAIMDLPSSNQKGQTMRVFESMAANKKLITTSETIRKQDFYNELNILIIKNCKEIDVTWLNSVYDKGIEYKEFSVDVWLKRVLGR